MKRIYIPISEAIRQARENKGIIEGGICACYEVENMGFCKDGKTRWYHFISIDGKPAYTVKR